MQFEKCQKTGKSRPVLVCSQEMSDKLNKLGYSIPTLITGYGAFYYLCDRAPTPSEPDCYSDISDFYYQWIDQNNLQVWSCLNNTLDAMVWQNIQAGTIRGLQSVSLAFSTSRQPSLTNDIEVKVSFNFQSLLALSSGVDVEVSQDNSTWITIDPILLGLAVGANQNQGSTFTVPPGYYYRFVKVGSATITVATLFELTK